MTKNQLYVFAFLYGAASVSAAQADLREDSKFHTITTNVSDERNSVTDLFKRAQPISFLYDPTFSNIARENLGVGSYFSTSDHNVTEEAIGTTELFMRAQVIASMYTPKTNLDNEDHLYSISGNVPVESAGATEMLIKAQLKDMALRMNEGEWY